MSASQSAASPTTQLPIASVTHKLRESCHACAASKLRCSKEKPTCTRCAKRGRACEYRASRRAGRSQSSATRASDLNCPAGTEASLTDGIWTIVPTTSKKNDLSEPAKVQGPVYPDISSNSFTTAANPETVGAFFGCFNDFTTSPLDLLSTSSTDPNIDPILFTPEALDHLLSTNGTSIESFFLDTQSSVFDGRLLEMSPQVEVPPGAELQMSPDLGISPLQESGSSYGASSDCSTGCCLDNLLEAVRQLSSVPSTRCRTVAAAKGGLEAGKSAGTHESSSRFQSIMAQNKHVVETVAGILGCDCSKDSFLLAMVSMAIFKLIDRYGAIAFDKDDLQAGLDKDKDDDILVPITNTSFSPDNGLRDTVITGSDHFDGPNRRRITAQSVLSELSPLQGLIKVWSQRLEVPTSKSREEGSNTPGTNRRQKAGTDKKGQLFSHDLLKQLEFDLRRRLRSLSGEIVETLRQA